MSCRLTQSTASAHEIDDEIEKKIKLRLDKITPVP
jgi:hypothetical protein